MARYCGPPMDLDNMRSLGMTKAERVRRSSDYRLSNLPGDLPVPDVRPRLRRSKCGGRPNETRPDWSNYRLRGQEDMAPPPNRRELVLDHGRVFVGCLV
jgi:hypothetical protein